VWQAALEAVKLDGLALCYAPEALKTASLCLDAVRRNGDALEYATEELKAALKREPPKPAAGDEEFRKWGMRVEAAGGRWVYVCADGRRPHMLRCAENFGFFENGENCEFVASSKAIAFERLKEATNFLNWRRTVFEDARILSDINSERKIALNILCPSITPACLWTRDILKALKWTLPH
jgi:hypothetical protein